MLRKTHMTVGVASALLITAPQTVPELVLASSVGAAGALISDIDVVKSGYRRSLDIVIVLTAVTMLAVFGLDYFLHIGILKRIVQDSEMIRRIAGTLLFIGSCAFGKDQPHRSFMHSFLALAVLSLAVFMVFPEAAVSVYFSIGFLSHLALDVMNQKKIRLFYPYKTGFCLGLFHADGIVNYLLFAAGGLISIVEIAKII